MNRPEQLGRHCQQTTILFARTQLNQQLSDQINLGPSLFAGIRLPSRSCIQQLGQAVHQLGNKLLAPLVRSWRSYQRSVLTRQTGDLTNLVGFNFRLTELQAAIGLVQLGKAEPLVAEREAIASELSRRLGELPGIVVPRVREKCRHVYYVWSARYDESLMGVPRDIFAKALEAEGVPVSVGYVAPLYLLPLFQKRVGIGSSGWPFTLTNRSYLKGLCPVTERLHERELLEVHVCSYALERAELDGVVNAFEKVYAGRHALTTRA